ncbi:ISAs1 family transposase [Agarivorans sp. QJM3NY_33]|uniref:ISAs1 family transposase n=1 Tax=Agarivorans sp. QJM3NY_33 TaxID=3421432 RepID=UPI003F6C7D8A
MFDALFLTVCATIGGANGWEDIKDFGEAHYDWLRDKDYLCQGYRYYTIARLIFRLNPAQFQQCFSRWISTVSERTDGQLIAVDDKVLLRSSYTRDDSKMNLTPYSVFFLPVLANLTKHF